jgi:hypothetical protein
MMRMRVRWVVLLLAVLLPALPALAQEAARPLLIPGKKTLYQRVLTQPQAQLRKAPQADAVLVGEPLPPFEIFFVYERQGEGEAGWLRVGRTDRGRSDGWLPAAQAIDWKQTITVAFNNPGTRSGPTLLFGTREQLMEHLTSESRVAETRRLRAEALAGRTDPASGVIAVEPETYVDVTRQLYLLPILGFSQDYLDDQMATILDVASVPKDRPVVRPPFDREAALRDFKVGVVFVVDTTRSMGPYIDRTREAVQRIYARVRGSDIGERTSFGLVGFRDATKALDQIEYVTRVFVELAPGQHSDRVLEQMAGMTATDVSTRGFTEDSLAGVKVALEQSRWEAFGGRYVVLITDAGPLPPKDPDARVQEAPAQIAARAQEQSIAIYTLHLKTPDGISDHPSAEAAYRDLSRFQQRSLYFDVAGGDVGAFGKRVDQLADALLAQVQDTMASRLTEAEATQEDEASTIAAVGRAMQLAYLGRLEGTQAPRVFQAWLADRDYEDPRRMALDVRLLITKGQLSSMRDVLKALVDAFEGNRQSRQNPAVLFEQVRSAIAAMLRTPERVGTTEFETLGEAIGEFLEDLPYQGSGIVTMTQADWAASGTRQRDIVDQIKQKLAHYEELYATPVLWTTLYPGAPEADAVYAMPLDALP